MSTNEIELSGQSNNVKREPGCEAARSLVPQQQKGSTAPTRRCVAQCASFVSGALMASTENGMPRRCGRVEEDEVIFV
ncbi:MULTISPECIES: hypothetical protein [Sorangium]|uniref:hypothetical protein n=1 Tax=Sorangium TaxID=39643 RepID=UPI00101AA6BD|nr:MULTISPECIES: hypothetical protein [Sorangium]